MRLPTLAGGVRGGLARGAGWLGARLLRPAYPLTAIEVGARSVGVVRLARQGRRLSLGSAACIELPEGALRLSMTEPNIADPGAFRSALGTALERAGALQPGRVALVLPDPVARVSLLPGAEVTGRRGEIEELIRFRLRKAVPFEVRDARIGWISGGPAGSMALVGAIFRPVLDAYEESCHALGLHPGLVELSGLALAETAFAGRRPADQLLVNWDHDYASLILAREGWPILIRTLVGESVAAPDQVAREVANTVLYYRDRLGGAELTRAVVRCSSMPGAEAAAFLQEPLGFLPEVLDPWTVLGVTGERLESAQAVAGAAACLIARAA